jgi:TP901 family phage tail tape measure protein
MAKGITVPVTQTGLSQSIQNAVKQVGGINVPVDIDSRSFKNLSQPLGRITGLATEFEKSIAASNARVIAFGASVGIINGIQGAFAELLRTGVEVQKILADIAAISGQSGAELSKFGDSIFDVAKNTSQSFKVAAQAALEFSRQGLSTDETIRRTNDALTLVRFTTLNAAEAVDVLTAATNSFSDSGITTSEILNKLVAVDTKFAVSAEDLANGLARAGSIAQEVGVSFDELNAAITITQERTARGGAVIGNALKTIFTRLRSDETVNALRSIGVESLNAQGGLKGAIPLLQEVATKIESLSGGERVQVLEAIASKYNINILSALLNDLNAANGKFAEVVEISGSAQNQAYERQIELNKTLAAQINLTTVSVTQLFNKLAEIGVTESLTSILKFVNDLLDGFNKLLDSETTGGNIAKGLIKGISDVFFTVGLPIIGAIFIKLTKDIAQFGVESLKTILGINQQVRERQALEQAVVNTLIKDRDVMASILALSGNRAKQEEYLLNVYNRQISALERVQSIATSVAPALVQGGLSATSGTVKRRAADGYLPAQEAADVKRGVGGADKNAKVVKIPNFSFGGGKKGTMYANTSEYIVPNYNGGDGTAIFNKDMVRKYGKPENAKKINAATGYIPNFADGKYIYDSDRLPADKNALLKKILASNVKKNLILGPAGTGKTTFAASGGTFITKPEDADKATEIDILSGAARTKDGGISANLESIISAVNVSGGKVSYLYAGNMEIIARRSGREEKGAGEGDLRSEKQIAGTKYAPLNQFDFIDKVKSKAKNFGIVKNAATGYIPNFAQKAQSQASEAQAEQRDSITIADARGRSAMLVPDKKNERIMEAHLNKPLSFGFQTKDKGKKLGVDYVKYHTYGLNQEAFQSEGLKKSGDLTNIEADVQAFGLDIAKKYSYEYAAEYSKSLGGPATGIQISDADVKNAFLASKGAVSGFSSLGGGIFETAIRTGVQGEINKDLLKAQQAELGSGKLDFKVTDIIKRLFGVNRGETDADSKIEGNPKSTGRAFADQIAANNLYSSTSKVAIQNAAAGYIPSFVKKEKTVSGLGRATMLLPSEEDAQKVNEQSLNLGVVPTEEKSRKTADRVKFRAYGLSEKGLKKRKINNVPKVFDIVKDAISKTGAEIVNAFDPLSEKIDEKSFYELYKPTEGAKGSLSAVAGSVFEVAIQKVANPAQNKKASNDENVTFDVTSLTPDLKDLFGIKTPEKFADYKISAATKGKFADQIIKNTAYKKIAAMGYVPNYAEKLSEMYDWDGTIIPKISGKSEEYIQSLQKLQTTDLLPIGKELVASKAEFDIATIRPIQFKDPIRQTAQRLGLKVDKVFPVGSMFDSRRTQGKRGERKLYGPERKLLLAEGTGRNIVDDEEANLAALGSRGINANLRNRGAFGFIPNFASQNAIDAMRRIVSDPAAPQGEKDAASLKLSQLTKVSSLNNPRVAAQKTAKTKLPITQEDKDYLNQNKEKIVAGMGRSFGMLFNLDALEMGDLGYVKRLDPIVAKKLSEIAQKQGGRDSIRSLVDFGSAAKGYIPNFADPLKEAVNREIAAGINPSQVRVTRDDRLMTTRNPEGIAVINTKDEPNGKVPSNRINEKNGRKAAAAKAFIPNFADPASGKITAGLEKGPEVKSDEFRAFTREVDKIARTFAEANKSVEELNAAFPKLKEDIANSANKFKIGQKTQDELIAASEKLKERTIQALSRPIGPVSVGTSSGPTLGPGVVPGTSAASAPAVTAASPAIANTIIGGIVTGAKNAAGTITTAVAAGLAAAKGAITPPADPKTTTGNAASGDDNKDKQEKKQALTLEKTFYAFSGLTLAANSLQQAFGNSESAVAKLAVGLANVAQSASQGALLGQSFGDLAKGLTEGKTGLLGTLGKVAGFAGPVGAAIGVVTGLVTEARTEAQERKNKIETDTRTRAQKSEEEDLAKLTEGKTPEESRKLVLTRIRELEAERRKQSDFARSEFLLEPTTAPGAKFRQALVDGAMPDEATDEVTRKRQKQQEEFAKFQESIKNLPEIDQERALSERYAQKQKEEEQKALLLLEIEEKRTAAARKLREITQGQRTATDAEKKAANELIKRVALTTQIAALNEANARGENAALELRAKRQSDFIKNSIFLTEAQKQNLQDVEALTQLDEKRDDLKKSILLNTVKELSQAGLATADQQKLDVLRKRLEAGEKITDIEKELNALGIQGNSEAGIKIKNALSEFRIKDGQLVVEKNITTERQAANKEAKTALDIEKLRLSYLEDSFKNQKDLEDIRITGGRALEEARARTPVAQLENQIATQPYATREQEAQLAKLRAEFAKLSAQRKIDNDFADVQRNSFEELRGSIISNVKGASSLGKEFIDASAKALRNAGSVSKLEETLQKLKDARNALFIRQNLSLDFGQDIFSKEDSAQLAEIENAIERSQDALAKYNLTVEQAKILLEEYNKQQQRQIEFQTKLAQLRAESPAKAGMFAAFNEIEQESENFQETFAKNTTLAFRDGMRDALGAAISQTDDLGAALQNVAMNFLKTMQNAFLQQASNQAMIGLQNAFPTVFPKGPAQGATGGFVSGGKIIKGYATGGLVTGGSGYKDDVPAMLSQGEYVIRKSSVEKYGAANLEKMNSGGMPRFAAGGDIFLPGTRGQTAISGYKDLTRFANQVTTSGSTDVMRGTQSSAFVNLEDQSMRLSRFALLNENDIANQEIRSAQQQGLDLITQREKYRTQQRKAFQKQLKQTVISAAINAGLGAMRGPSVPYSSTQAGMLEAGAPNALAVRSGLAYGGMIKRYASGGPVDKIPALLMDGEYVMSNKATKKYGKQFFDSINQGRTPRFANGGEVGAGGEMLGEKFDNLSNKLETRGSSEVNITVNVTNSGSSETKAQGESNQGGVDYKKMSEKIKAVVLETINEEKRLGGSLRPRN